MQPNHVHDLCEKKQMERDHRSDINSVLKELEDGISQNGQSMDIQSFRCKIRDEKIEDNSERGQCQSMKENKDDENDCNEEVDEYSSYTNSNSYSPECSEKAVQFDSLVIRTKEKNQIVPNIINDGFSCGHDDDIRSRQTVENSTFTHSLHRSTSDSLGNSKIDTENEKHSDNEQLRNISNASTFSTSSDKISITSISDNFTDEIYFRKDLVQHPHQNQSTPIQKLNLHPHQIVEHRQEGTQELFDAIPMTMNETIVTERVTHSLVKEEYVNDHSESSLLPLGDGDIHQLADPEKYETNEIVDDSSIADSNSLSKLNENVNGIPIGIGECGLPETVDYKVGHSIGTNFSETLRFVQPDNYYLIKKEIHSNRPRPNDQLIDKNIQIPENKYLFLSSHVTTTTSAITSTSGTTKTSHPTNNISELIFTFDDIEKHHLPYQIHENNELINSKKIIKHQPIPVVSDSATGNLPHSYRYPKFTSRVNEPKESDDNDDGNVKDSGIGTTMNISSQKESDLIDSMFNERHSLNEKENVENNEKIIRPPTRRQFYSNHNQKTDYDDDSSSSNKPRENHNETTNNYSKIYEGIRVYNSYEENNRNLLNEEISPRRRQDEKRRRSNESFTDLNERYHHEQREEEKEEFRRKCEEDKKLKRKIHSSVDDHLNGNRQSSIEGDRKPYVYYLTRPEENLRRPSIDQMKETSPNNRDYLQLDDLELPVRLYAKDEEFTQEKFEERDVCTHTLKEEKTLWKSSKRASAKSLKRNRFSSSSLLKRSSRSLNRLSFIKNRLQSKNEKRVIPLSPPPPPLRTVSLQPQQLPNKSIEHYLTEDELNSINNENRQFIQQANEEAKLVEEKIKRTDEDIERLRNDYEQNDRKRLIEEERRQAFERQENEREMKLLVELAERKKMEKERIDYSYEDLNRLRKEAEYRWKNNLERQEQKFRQTCEMEKDENNIRTHLKRSNASVRRRTKNQKKHQMEKELHNVRRNERMYNQNDNQSLQLVRPLILMTENVEDRQVVTNKVTKRRIETTSITPTKSSKPMLISNGSQQQLNNNQADIDKYHKYSTEIQQTTPRPIRREEEKPIKRSSSKSKGRNCLSPCSIRLFSSGKGKKEMKEIKYVNNPSHHYQSDQPEQLKTIEKKRELEKPVVKIKYEPQNMENMPNNMSFVSLNKNLINDNYDHLHECSMRSLKQPNEFFNYYLTKDAKNKKESNYDVLHNCNSKSSRNIDNHHSPTLSSSSNNTLSTTSPSLVPTSPSSTQSSSDNDLSTKRESEKKKAKTFQRPNIMKIFQENVRRIEKEAQEMSNFSAANSLNVTTMKDDVSPTNIINYSSGVDSEESWNKPCTKQKGCRNRLDDRIYSLGGFSSGYVSQEDVPSPSSQENKSKTHPQINLSSLSSEKRNKIISIYRELLKASDRNPPRNSRDEMQILHWLHNDKGQMNQKDVNELDTIWNQLKSDDSLIDRANARDYFLYNRTTTSVNTAENPHENTERERLDWKRKPRALRSIWARRSGLPDKVRDDLFRRRHSPHPNVSSTPNKLPVQQSQTKEQNDYMNNHKQKEGRITCATLVEDDLNVRRMKRAQSIGTLNIGSISSRSSSISCNASNNETTDISPTTADYLRQRPKEVLDSLRKGKQPLASVIDSKCLNDLAYRKYVLMPSLVRTSTLNNNCNNINTNQFGADIVRNSDRLNIDAGRNVNRLSVRNLPLNFYTRVAQ
ncbi:hypothetical protein SNEBB_003143 [Seison nebaliae]|nr:hypothetical protein SNEBB_003143 [Seison nebaliae]